MAEVVVMVVVLAVDDQVQGGHRLESTKQQWP